MHFMINGVTMKILADDYILRALQEDVTSEDVTTNAVMPMPKQGIGITALCLCQNRAKRS